MLADDNSWYAFRVMKHHNDMRDVEWAVFADIHNAVKFILVTSEDYGFNVSDFYIEVV